MRSGCRRNRPRLHCLKDAVAVRIGLQAAEAAEIRIGFSSMRVERMRVPALCISLPQLNHRIARSGRAVAVGHAEREPDALALRALARQDSQRRLAVRAKLKNGPTVCEAVGIKLISPSSNGVARRPLSTMSKRYPSAHSGSVSDKSKSRDEPLLRVFVRNRLEDRIERNQRIVREVHLRNQPRHECGSKQREVNVRRPPRVGMVAPGIGARLDREKPVVPSLVRDRSGPPQEVWIKRSWMMVARLR